MTRYPGVAARQISQSMLSSAAKAHICLLPPDTDTSLLRYEESDLEEDEEGAEEEEEEVEEAEEPAADKDAEAPGRSSQPQNCGSLLTSTSTSRSDPKTQGRS